MFTPMIGTGILALVLFTGWSPLQVEVPAPVPNPGPGPTVPPKPSDPIPVPPTTPKFSSTAIPARERASPILVAADRPSSQEPVSGKLLSLDLDKREGRLGTDLGREVLFHIPKPELFAHVSVGQRVTIKLDASQQAIGVLESTAPELPAPSSAP